jgi:hypothetical protein
VHSKHKPDYCQLSPTPSPALACTLQVSARPRGRSRLGERRIRMLTRLLLLAWTCLLLEFRQLLHGYSDQQPPCGPVFRLSAGQRLISRSARPRAVFAFLRAGLGNLFDLCTAYCQQTKCIMPSHLFDGKHGAPRGESMSCHATPWRDVGWMQRWGGCGIQQCEVER